MPETQPIDNRAATARARIRKAVRKIFCRNPQCGHGNSPYAQMCERCSTGLNGGVVFSSGQSGTAQHEWLAQLQQAVQRKEQCYLHDVGETMEEFARQFDSYINWDRILDRTENELRFRRAQAFGEITHKVLNGPADIHLLACHVIFRWNAFLTRGLDPHLLAPLQDNLRMFLTVIDGVNEVHRRLSVTDWGDRKRLQLALWRDEEVFITGLLADLFRRPHYVISREEPADNMADLILRPWRPRVYFSFPITAFVGQPDEQWARAEIESVRDAIRQWAVVFDPYAIKDYDLTYQVPEMSEIAKELGEQTEQRDYRFIDQSEILIAFFPKAAPSKGVEAELRHARTTGKIIYLCYPQQTGGPFSISPDYLASSKEEFLNLIRDHFEGLDEPVD